MFYDMAKRLGEVGLTSACLWVLDPNTPVRLFYEHHGGTVFAERQDDHRGTSTTETATVGRILPAFRGKDDG